MFNYMGKIGHKEKMLEQRLKESTEILSKYPDRICIFIEKKDTCKSLPDLDKKKYLVPKTITVAQLIFVIRNKIKVTKETALFFYVNRRIINGDTTMDELEYNYKSPDGFLYIKYAGENCFG